MTRTRTMYAPDERRRLDDMAQGLVGQPMDRPDGPLKVSGRATYAHEANPAGRAYGVFVRAPFTKGRITDFGEDKVEGLPGVLGVFHDDRFLRNPAQGGAGEAPEQSSAAVAYFGQIVALVVAESFEQARHAAQTLELTFDAEDAIVDPEDNSLDSETDDDAVDQGDLEAAMHEAAHSIDVTYRTPAHNSAAMEPHCSIAEWNGDRLTLRGSYQMLNYNIDELADSLGIEPGKHPYALALCRRRLRLETRHFAGGRSGRHRGEGARPSRHRRHGAAAGVRGDAPPLRDAPARPPRRRCRGTPDRSRARSSGLQPAGRGVRRTRHPVDPLPLWRRKPEACGRCLSASTGSGAGSVRAPGEAVGMPVLENAMDELAEAIGMDPVELRRKNIPERHPEENIPYSSRRYADAMDEGARRFGWADRNKKPGSLREGDWLIGHGMAGASRVNMLGAASARVTLSRGEDGDDGEGGGARAVVETDMTDIGTGTYAILTQIAGEMLGLPGGAGGDETRRQRLSQGFRFGRIVGCVVDRFRRLPRLRGGTQAAMRALRLRGGRSDPEGRRGDRRQQKDAARRPAVAKAPSPPREGWSRARLVTRFPKPPTAPISARSPSTRSPVKRGSAA